MYGAKVIVQILFKFLSIRYYPPIIPGLIVVIYVIQTPEKIEPNNDKDLYTKIWFRCTTFIVL